uniref:Fructose-1,6-bisphosphatase/sedoheptulose-1,7-bis phosphatase n=1 Tax=Paulinella chromatophora TaxID=39717 RepID=B1X448_PAUCH|nr:Fructose-1,6-bisphosphatase/sedoheptulose-1,7- bis phosphatase [Paulinella chromatophora]ACB42717.1 Fructose-1,6-bisphosphatase/sedoheptulose-1,7- bis phosphatase [Paulinella chromatophora]|eukprot:gb/GEZN01000282.1/.p2 GENE.gb/GEZN01000282.1/~~gb/GEZN01000282.1/.p2  ORF type:complete len:335 (-),score=16.82 gb/GEZN01000282.1/:2200-3204(-)
MDRTLIQELLEVVEQAAIASARLTGLGKKDEADAAAVEAMRNRMASIQMQGRIVIGEGERDEAPMLYIGEEVGSGTGPGVDFAVDPCEGTNLCANAQDGSMAVLAASDRGGLFNAPDFYMKKLAVPPAAKGKVDIRKGATENINILSQCLGIAVTDLVIVVMDRARHKGLISEIRATGARVKPISDGDVQAAIACGFAGTGTHCLMGIGAAPEGVISAAALRCLGAHFQGQLVYDPAVAMTSEWADYTKEGNIARLNEMGITDIDKVYEADELASGENVAFAGGGITDGLLFKGVKFERDCTRTSSLVISSLDKTARFTDTIHIKENAQSVALR